MSHPWIEVDGYEPCREERCARIDVHPVHDFDFKADDEQHVWRWRGRKRGGQRGQEQQR